MKWPSNVSDASQTRVLSTLNFQDTHTYTHILHIQVHTYIFFFHYYKADDVADFEAWPTCTPEEHCKRTNAGFSYITKYTYIYIYACICLESPSIHRAMYISNRFFFFIPFSFLLSLKNLFFSFSVLFIFLFLFLFGYMYMYS